MEWLYRHTQIKLGIFSVIGAFLVTFSTLICIPWEMPFFIGPEIRKAMGGFLSPSAAAADMRWVYLGGRSLV